MLTGSCLCGAVSFVLHGGVTDIYQCHCSLCRKSMGSGGCAICLSSGADFEWKSGQDQIQLYAKETGYGKGFCRTCGSQVPAANDDQSTYWIPAGLLDQQDPGIKVGAHIFVGSKASWDVIGDTGIQFTENFPE